MWTRSRHMPLGSDSSWMASSKSWRRRGHRLRPDGRAVLAPGKVARPGPYFRWPEPPRVPSRGTAGEECPEHRQHVQCLGVAGRAPSTTSPSGFAFRETHSLSSTTTLSPRVRVVPRHGVPHVDVGESSGHRHHEGEPGTAPGFRPAGSFGPFEDTKDGPGRQ